ncbi:MAG TPA: DNA translocase FtsK 4TM domain-containing protein [Anaerolineales bacterium]|nr:DNA translocase FtsK 4TM domain-containing protein [Anaerolineales bacterium]
MATRKSDKTAKKAAPKSGRRTSPAGVKPSSRRAPVQRGKPAARKPAPGARAPSGRTPGVRTPGVRTPGVKGRVLPAAPRQSWFSGLSLDRKLDLLGVGMTLIGLLTLLSLLSSTNGWFSAGWLTILNTAFGWGMYLLPLGLIGVGLWLILRHFDRLPQLALERVVGLVLLYFNLLAWFHYFAFPADRVANFALGEAGRGGGLAGAGILAALHASLGWAGTGIALFAWTLIGLALTLDVSVPELFQWATPFFERLKDAWSRWQSSRAARSPRPVPSPGFNPLTSTPRSEATASESDAPASLPGALPHPSSRPAATPTWVLPPIEQILDSGGEVSSDDEIDRQSALLIEETLASFGAPAKVVEINRGPTITQFGVEPGFIESRNGPMRVRVSKIASLADDLALALAARRIRIQAPVPSKGFVGIEVPNEDVSLVALRDVIENPAFQRLKSPLRFALGQDVAGNAAAADLAAMPHLLIAGTTGSGKSVCVNAVICCLLLNNTPDDLRLIMVDPKRVELTGYNGIPHLLAPVVVELERVIGALQWVAREMDMRYRKLAQAGARNIADYNARLAARGEKKLPYLVVVIDELADLMMLAPDETERTITRLAQLARATGIHLVIATQRPSVDVVTGLIKANFPARIAFVVASGVDSRVILDQPGAERLLGRGDMLFQAPDAPAPVRLQGAFVSDAETQLLVAYWRGLAGTVESAPMAAGGVVDAYPPGIPLKQMPLWDEMEKEEELDPLYAESVDLVRRQGRASISMLQRRLRIGYTRSARLIETMQAKGVVGPNKPGTQGLEILDYGPAGPPREEEGD